MGLNTQQAACLPSGAALLPDEGGLRQQEIAALQELALPKVREPVLNWAKIEPKPGAGYDYAWSDAVIERLQDPRIEVLAVFAGVPGWAAAEPGEAPIAAGLPAREHADAFAAVVRAFAHRYGAKPRAPMPKLRVPVREYQFMEDIEAYPPAEYAYWLKVFRTAIKEADPEAVVVLGGLSSPGVRPYDQPEGDQHLYFERLLAEDVLQGPDYPCFDVAAFHHFMQKYPGRIPFNDAFAYLRQTMAGRNLNLPVWVTAYGMDSGERDESAQAAEIVKWAVHGKALGIDRFYLYCLRDHRLPGETGVGRNFGLLREARPEDPVARKPAFRAFARLLGEIAERPTISARGEGIYMMTGTGEPTYVVWKSPGHDPSSFLIPGWWEIRTIGGKSMVRQGSRVNLSDRPEFLQRVNSPFIR